jgi:hypothetical protein
MKSAHKLFLHSTNSSLFLTRQSAVSLEKNISFCGKSASHCTNFDLLVSKKLFSKTFSTGPEGNDETLDATKKWIWKKRQDKLPPTQQQVKPLKGAQKIREQIEEIKQLQKGKLKSSKKLPLPLAEYEILCGVDEAGRGAAFGPLVVCAVLIPKTSVASLPRSGTSHLISYCQHH